jgi:hypothetical protein
MSGTVILGIGVFGLLVIVAMVIAAILIYNDRRKS